MGSFVESDSIVRRIWSDTDLVLLVFAGSAAEFALNRACDWLFVTGALPHDPLGRLFSTAAYARRITLGSADEADRTLASIRAAHSSVERMRGARIPDWAHRDVLYMLIDYSERAFLRLHRALSGEEREDLYGVFRRMGTGLGVPDLPPGYAAWTADRERHLQRDLARSGYTMRLYGSYRRQLGAWRYALLLQLQAALVPDHVRTLLELPNRLWGDCLLPVYATMTASRTLRALAHRVLIPQQHLPALRQLDESLGAQRRSGG